MKFQPQIIDSLLAIKIFFVSGIIFKVGSRPSIPEIALTQNDTFFLIIEFIFLIPKCSLIFFFLKNRFKF